MKDIYNTVFSQLARQDFFNSDLCCLCLATVDISAISVNDEITLSMDRKGNVTVENMAKILIETIGGKIADIITALPSICRQCSTAVLSSYKTIKSARENIDNFISAVNDLGSCFENVAETDTEDSEYKSLFVAINSKDKTIQQFYDLRKQADPCETALARFHFIAYGISSKNTTTKKRIRDASTIFIKTHELVADPSKPKEYKCKMCLKDYPSAGNLRQHFFSAHFKKEFKCTQCPKSFGTSGLLQTHLNVSHKTVPCGECGKLLLNRKSTIKRHLMIHSKALKVCNRCGRSYKKRQDFERHIARDTCLAPSKTPGDFICDTCDFRCIYKYQLLTHIKFEHGGAPGHVCQWCEKKFYSASALKTHTLKHTKERNFVCTECGGKFVTKQSLLNHSRLHSGERPYKCSYCDQSFLSASRRSDHVERYHIGQTYDCDLCDAKYNARRSLVKHRKVHFINEVVEEVSTSTYHDGKEA